MTTPPPPPPPIQEGNPFKPGTERSPRPAAPQIIVEKAKPDSTTNWLLLIIIAILTSPVWLPIVGFIFAVVIMALLAIFSQNVGL